MRHFVVALLFWGTLSACASLHQPPGTGMDQPAVGEKNLWRQAESLQDGLERKGLLYNDARVERYLNQIASCLLPPEDQKQMPIKVKVIRCPYPDALAFANGRIYIHTGLLARLENEAQLAFLLAHELTHITHNHALRMLHPGQSQFADQDGPEKAVKAADPGRQEEVTAGLVSNVEELETEADVVGLELTRRAGYDPWAALGLLEDENRDEDFRQSLGPGNYLDASRSMKQRRTMLARRVEPQERGVTNRQRFLENLAQLILDNAVLDLKAGRFEAADAGLRKYLSIRADEPKAYYVLGEIIRGKAERDGPHRAEGYYRKAIALDPTYPEPYRAIGLLRYKGGMREDARRYFQSYLSLAPQAPDRAYIEQYLRREY